MVKIATWNLCLGLVSKKDYVINTLKKEEIDICMMQEAEIKRDYDRNLLSDKEYKIEVEVSTDKSRCATFIKNGVDYERRSDLEGIDNHLVIIDFNVSHSYRAINIYRSFNPPNNETQLQHFQKQLNLIRIAITTLGHRKVIVGGDFNLDYNKINDISYRNKSLCEILSLWAEDANLIQIIEFATWHRVVNETYKESLLDHFYVRDPTQIVEVIAKNPLIGDHKLIILNIPSVQKQPKIVIKRSWKEYSKTKLLEELANVNFVPEPNDPQNYWNMMENILLPIINKLAPKIPFKNNVTTKSIKPNKQIKNKLNLRKRLIKNLKTNASNALRD
jgi:exonuclease III